ncbi:MAG: M23 family metallopeptidase, partial [Gemmatimonadetes bacterium]|nr:M23 family metallopeptidase [Gemmatimonadota bacterium]
MSSTLGWTRAAALLVALTASGCSVPRWPVHGRLTSPFGLRGFWPEVHRGVDVSVPDGTPVQAMKAGVVEFAGTLSGYGNVVVLRHGNNLETVYAHLSEIRVRRGERVA